MTLSRAEAMTALNEAEAVGQQMRRSGGYSLASPHLILWGAVWILGYVGSGLTDPRLWGLVWAPLVLGGVAGAVLIGYRSRRRGVQSGGASGRSFLLAAAILLFFLSVYAVFRPVGVVPYLVFPALVTALIYVTIGLYGWPRFAWIGSAIFLVTMLSFFFAQPWLPFCIGAAGGGGLVLGGLWLRAV